MSRRIEIRLVLDEWMVGEERHRIIEWSDGTHEYQRIWVEHGLARWEGQPMSHLDIWDRYPHLAPPFEREKRWRAAQEARRQRVWWRRILREAGWR